MLRSLQSFFALESASGLVLLIATALAMGMANSPLLPYYETMRQPLVVLVINDGLMAVFFLLIGIEIRHEFTAGSLRGLRQALFPIACAAAGVAVPALIFSYINWGLPTLRGWAIPTATDIAFALGALAIFGKRIAPELRVFLLAVAVIDDLIAVSIIALFYTASINMAALGVAAACIALMLFYRKKKIQVIAPYVFAGAALWCAFLASGVHPTIAGVLTGLLMPPAAGKKILHVLHPFVAFGIIPLFAFANAGITLAEIGIEQALEPLTLGIMLGLFAGKQIGIFMIALLWVWLGWARRPAGAGWLEFYAVSLMAGIGFTMSLFIGSLSFSDPALIIYTRLGVIVGSLISALAGIVIMALAIGLKAKKYE